MTRARSVGHQSRGAWRPPAGSSSKRSTPLDLIPLDVDEEDVGAALAARRSTELGEQVLLQRAHAEDEEAAEADRQQDDARLVARTAEAEDGMAQREPARRASGRAGADEQPRRAVEHDGDHGEAAETIEPARSEPACQDATATSAALTSDCGGHLQPVDRSRAVAASPRSHRRAVAAPAARRRAAAAAA